MHIDELSIEQVQQAIVDAGEQAAMAAMLGMKKSVKQLSAYKNALWERLNELQPVPEISEDQLLAELELA